MKAKGSRVCSGAIVLFVFVCLLLAGAAAVHRDGEVAHGVAIGRGAQLRIPGQVADQNDLIHASTSRLYSA